MVSEFISKRLDIMSRISHPEEYYKQSFLGKGFDISQLTHEEISVGVAAMKTVEADILIWAAEHIPSMPVERIEKVVDEVIKKGW